MTIEALLGRIGLTAQQQEVILSYCAAAGHKVAPFSRAYMREGKTMDECLAAARSLDLGGLHKMSLDLVFDLQAALYLYEDYERAGLSESLYLQTMQDIRCKVNECFACFGILGLIRVEWHDGFFRRARFAFGRLQFDLNQFPLPDTALGRHTVKKGELALACHIPSSGPLPHDACIDSYKQAYAFMKDSLRKDGLLPITCHSWFLYPDYQPLFAGTNIGLFSADYTLLRRDDTPVFADAWRVFSRDLSCGTAPLPRETSLQRRFIDYIDGGGRFGVGLGCLLFDGERVLPLCGSDAICEKGSI